MEQVSNIGIVKIPSGSGISKAIALLIRQYGVSGGRNSYFLENLGCLAFLQSMFRESLFCFVTKMVVS